MPSSYSFKRWRPKSAYNRPLSTLTSSKWCWVCSSRIFGWNLHRKSIYWISFYVFVFKCECWWLRRRRVHLIMDCWTSKWAFFFPTIRSFWSFFLTGSRRLFSWWIRCSSLLFQSYFCLITLAIGHINNHFFKFLSRFIFLLMKFSYFCCKLWTWSRAIMSYFKATCLFIELWFLKQLSLIYRSLSWDNSIRDTIKVWFSFYRILTIRVIMNNVTFNFISAL